MQECKLGTRRMEKVWLVDRWQETGYELGSSTDERRLETIEGMIVELDVCIQRADEKLAPLDRDNHPDSGGYYRPYREELTDEEEERFGDLFDELLELRHLASRYENRKRALRNAIAGATAQRRAEFVAKFARSPEYHARLNRSLANVAAQRAIDDLCHMDDHAQKRDKGQPDEACLTAICPGSSPGSRTVFVRNGRPTEEVTGTSLSAEFFRTDREAQPGQQAPEARDARARQDAGDGEGLSQGVQGNCLTHGVYFTPYCSECIGTPRFDAKAANARMSKAMRDAGLPDPVPPRFVSDGSYAVVDGVTFAGLPTDPAPHAARQAGTPGSWHIMAPELRSSDLTKAQRERVFGFDTDPVLGNCAQHGPFSAALCPNCELDRKLRAVEDETARLKREAEKRRIDDNHQAVENARFARDKFWTERGKAMYAENVRLSEQLDRVNMRPFKAEDVCGVGVLKYEPPVEQPKRDPFAEFVRLMYAGEDDAAAALLRSTVERERGILGWFRRLFREV